MILEKKNTHQFLRLKKSTPITGRSQKIRQFLGKIFFSSFFEKSIQTQKYIGLL
jgi:hypothetical protein